MTQEEYIHQLERQNAELLLRIKGLEEQVRLLSQQQASGKVRKTSQNSHLPPSTDYVRKNQSLREKSSKKSGGQAGHEGSTLAMRAVADQTEVLASSFCRECGCGLDEIEKRFKEKRQVIDLPAVRPICTEYQQFECVCPHCATLQAPAFPAHVQAPVQYGEGIHSLVSYLNVYQYLPYKRLKEFLAQYAGLAISEGTIYNILSSMAQKGQQAYQTLGQQLVEGQVVGSDETSVKVEGKKQWLWTWQNQQITFLAAGLSRGKAMVEDWFAKGFSQAVLISDRWKAQLSTPAKAHQLCLAHLLRDLNYLIEAEKEPWAQGFKDVLKEAIGLKKKKASYSQEDPCCQQIEHRTTALLAEQLDQQVHPQTCTFQKSMNQYRETLFRFLYNPWVEYDNNGSERAIRNIKVKTRISGQFKSGQDAYCILRSLADTAIKNDQPVFDVFQNIYHQPKPTAE